MQVLVKNWLVDAEKTEVAHLWAAVNVWLKYRSCLVGLGVDLFLGLNLGVGLSWSSVFGLGLRLHVCTLHALI